MWFTERVMTMEKSKIAKPEEKPMSWIKGLLNNQILLKWVKKYSADNLTQDNKLAEKFGIKCSEESISVGDKTFHKLMVTQGRYEGKEYSRYNAKQLKETLDVVGKESELVVSADESKHLIIQVKDTAVVISPLPASDNPEESD